MEAITTDGTDGTTQVTSTAKRQYNRLRRRIPDGGAGGVRGIDVEALANLADEWPNRKMGKTRHALMHIPSGLFLKVENHHATRYSVTASDPSIRANSTLSFWLNRMDKPEDWKIVAVKVVLDTEGDDDGDGA